MTKKARYNLQLTIEIEQRDRRIDTLPNEVGLANWIGDTLRIDPPLLPPDTNFKVRRVTCTAKGAAVSVANSNKDRRHGIVG